MAGLVANVRPDAVARFEPTAVMGFFLLVSAVLALLSFWTRRYRTAPELEAVVEFMARDEEWLRWQFLGNIQEAKRINASKLKWKVRLLTCSMVTLLVAIMLAAGYLIR